MGESIMGEDFERKTGDSFEKTPTQDRTASQRGLGRLAIAAATQKQADTTRLVGKTAVESERTQTARHIGRAAIQPTTARRSR